MAVSIQSGKSIAVFENGAWTSGDRQLAEFLNVTSRPEEASPASGDPEVAAARVAIRALSGNAKIIAWPNVVLPPDAVP